MRVSGSGANGVELVLQAGAGQDLKNYGLAYSHLDDKRLGVRRIRLRRQVARYDTVGPLHVTGALTLAARSLRHPASIPLAVP